MMKKESKPWKQVRCQAVSDQNKIDRKRFCESLLIELRIGRGERPRLNQKVQPLFNHTGVSLADLVWEDETMIRILTESVASLKERGENYIEIFCIR